MVFSWYDQRKARQKNWSEWKNQLEIKYIKKLADGPSDVCNIVYYQCWD